MNQETGIALIGLLLYFAIFCGVLLLYYEKIRIGIARFRMYHRLEARKAQNRKRGESNSRLARALSATTGKRVAPSLFLVVCGMLFLSTAVLCRGTLTPLFAFLASVAAALTPVLFLWIRLETLRKKGSYEGETLLCEFLRQYRISERNVCDSIEMVIEVQNELPVTGKLLFGLLLKLRATGDPLKIKMATDDFAFALGTNWSRMFAHNLCTAAVHGTDISLAAEDILIQLREARAAAEERKRLNSEAARMTCFLVPALYAATVFMAIRYLELPLSRFLENQFASPEGLLFFLLIALLFLVNLGLLTLVVRQKYDY